MHKASYSRFPPPLFVSARSRSLWQRVKRWLDDRPDTPWFNEYKRVTDLILADPSFPFGGSTAPAPASDAGNPATAQQAEISTGCWTAGPRAEGTDTPETHPAPSKTVVPTPSGDGTAGSRGADRQRRNAATRSRLIVVGWRRPGQALEMVVASEFDRDWGFGWSDTQARM